MADRQCAAGRGSRGANRRCPAQRRRRATIRTAAPPGSASSRPTARACSTASAPALASAGANIIDARIHTTRDGMALDNLLVLDGRGAALCRPAAAQAAGEAVEAALIGGAAAAAAVGRSRSARSVGLRGRAVRRHRRAGVDPHDRRRGQCARPAGAARRLAAALYGCGHIDPLRPYRHLWRARGRRLLPDRRRTGGSSTPAQVERHSRGTAAGGARAAERSAA